MPARRTFAARDRHVPAAGNSYQRRLIMVWVTALSVSMVLAFAW